MYIFSFFIRFKLKLKNKLTRFERGFCTINKIHGSFSIRFFIILLIFVIFDLEIVLLIRLLYLNSIFSFLFFIIFIIFGLYFEWYLGKLS